VDILAAQIRSADHARRNLRPRHRNLQILSQAQVIKHANDTSYGLAAACHTKDYERAIRVTNALGADTTWVNMYNLVHQSIPFGGFKESGIGRECGAAVLENYTQTKAVFCPQ